MIELVATGEQVACQSGHDAIETVQLDGHFGDDTVPPEPSRGDLQIGVEFVQVPPDLGGDPLVRCTTRSCQ